jgi:hypothetical protein
MKALFLLALLCGVAWAQLFPLNSPDPLARFPDLGPPSPTPQDVQRIRDSLGLGQGSETRRVCRISFKTEPWNSNPSSRFV